MALKYVKRGYHVLCSHGLVLLLMPLAAMGLVSEAGAKEGGGGCGGRRLWTRACE